MGGFRQDQRLEIPQISVNYQISGEGGPMGINSMQKTALFSLNLTGEKFYSIHNLQQQDGITIKEQATAG